MAACLRNPETVSPLDDILLPLAESPIIFRGKDGGDIGGLRGKEIAELGRVANTGQPSLMGTSSPLISYLNRFFLSSEEWQHCLKIYENNQLVLKEQSQHQALLDGLENWFLMVVEPPPAKPLSGKGRARTSRVYKAALEDWREELREWHSRELSKKSGHSFYCDPELTDRTRADSRVLARVEHNCRRLDSTLVELQK